MIRIISVTAAVAALGLTAIAAPTAAQAQYYGSYLNQPRSYGTPYYVPPPPPAYTAPAYTRPRVVVTPPTYGYGSGAYFDYRHYGDPTTRDSLATCAYC